MIRDISLYPMEKTVVDTYSEISVVVIQISLILFTEDIGSFLCLVGESGRIADIRRQTELILSESPHSSFGICGRVSRVMSLIRVWSLLLLLLPSKAPTDPRCQADIKKLFPARLLPFVMFLLPSFLPSRIQCRRRQSYSSQGDNALCSCSTAAADNDCIKRGGI